MCLFRIGFYVGWAKWRQPSMDVARTVWRQYFANAIKYFSNRGQEHPDDKYNDSLSALPVHWLMAW